MEIRSVQDHAPRHSGLLMMVVFLAGDGVGPLAVTGEPILRRVKDQRGQDILEHHVHGLLQSSLYSTLQNLDRAVELEIQVHVVERDPDARVLDKDIRDGFQFDGAERHCYRDRERAIVN